MRNGEAQTCVQIVCARGYVRKKTPESLAKNAIGSSTDCPWRAPSDRLSGLTRRLSGLVRWYCCVLRRTVAAMKIWVDADACPVAVKEILYRAANRAQVPLTLIANRMLRVPPSPWIRALQVPGGFDVADQRIAEEAQAGDLIITADVPLAAQVIAKGAVVIDPRGELLNASNIQERLTMRNFLDGLRSSGVETGGPPALSSADRQSFANQLDRLLAKR